MFLLTSTVMQPAEGVWYLVLSVVLNSVLPGCLARMHFLGQIVRRMQNQLARTSSWGLPSWRFILFLNCLANRLIQTAVWQVYKNIVMQLGATLSSKWWHFLTRNFLSLWRGLIIIIVGTGPPLSFSISLSISSIYLLIHPSVRQSLYSSVHQRKCNEKDLCCAHNTWPVWTSEYGWLLWTNGLKKQ